MSKTLNITVDEETFDLLPYERGDDFDLGDFPCKVHEHNGVSVFFNLPWSFGEARYEGERYRREQAAARQSERQVKP